MQDHVDILLSLSAQPNIVINDVASMTVAHGNRRSPGMFHPHEGRLEAPSDYVLRRVTDGQFSKSLPWLEVGQFTTHTPVPDHHYGARSVPHPVTNSTEHYSLTDNFHKFNVSNPADRLRDVLLVPELHGTNTQVCEQLFSRPILNRSS